LIRIQKILLLVLAIILLTIMTGISFFFADKLIAKRPLVTFSPNYYAGVLKPFSIEDENISKKEKGIFDITEIHPNVKTEWWYVNSHLFSDGILRYTLMISLLTDGKVFAGFTDIQGKEHNKVESLTGTEFLTNRKKIVAPFMEFTQPYTNFLCYTYNFDGPRVKLWLEMCANKKPVAMGETSIIRMGLNGKSSYYSITNLSIQGSAEVDGKKFNLTGKGWMDRQWGTWSDEDFDQWQWIAIQLPNDTEIMVYNFTKNDHDIADTCSVVWPDGKAQHNLKYSLETFDYWLSIRTGISWPVGWHLKIESLKADFLITPDINNQEISRALWEGGCTVHGTFQGTPVYARAFFETRRRAW